MAIYGDEDKEVATRALQSTSDLLRKLGPALVSDRLDAVFKCIVDLL